jgi:seryl-tRNA synthetase
MLDLKWVRENAEAVKAGASLKNTEVDIAALLDLDARRRELVTHVEELKHERNELSADVGRRMKAKEDAEPIKARVREIAEESKSLDETITAMDAELRDRLLRIPNVPHESVPHGRDETSNRVLREWGKKPQFDFQPKGHWEIGEKLGILHLEQGSRISGHGFVVYSGQGARLQRALINFMLDLHTTAHGYTEVLPPYLVTRETMTGTGQLPKLEHDMYRIESDDLFLIPTAEVPVTNLRRDEILAASELPLYYAAYAPCVRREAGSYGKETRGITRIHQFDKVELVKIVKPEDSFAELDTLLAQAEAVLQALDLHYRVVEICTGDLSFANCKQYDLEVWAPGMDRYLEVSSCSNFADYQARRTNIRFRREAKAKPEFVHTLNGSALALPRTMVAILEQYQQPDGTVRLPLALQSVLGRAAI